MKHRFLSIPAIMSILIFSCQSEKTGTEYTEVAQKDTVTTETIAEPIILENKGITLTEVLGSPEFPDSKLVMNTPKINDTLEIGPVSFNWSIIGGKYTLGMQSTDAETKECANSGKGQHIHVILNNEPYEASYDTAYTTKAELKAGNHVALTFISRSYHESLKHKDAYAITQFKVGEEEMDEADLTAPHMFYSRPKGTYQADNAAKVMLDFYLVNTAISEGGNYVHVALNDSIEFNLTKWSPYFIEGLPMGDNKVQLQLMDKDGNVIPGPYNVVEREFSLLQ